MGDEVSVSSSLPPQDPGGPWRTKRVAHSLIHCTLEMEKNKKLISSQMLFREICLGLPERGPCWQHVCPLRESKLEIESNRVIN